MQNKGGFQTAILIDDSETDLLILRRFIEFSHFADDVITFTSPLEALKVLGAHVYEGSSTIVFLDLNMPMMDGFEFLEKFNAIRNNVNEFKVVILTGSERPTDYQRAKEFPNIIRYINKSFSFDWLDLLIMKGWDYSPLREKVAS